jgi:predicted anti-sigma-YlaC factor YlaD
MLSCKQVASLASQYLDKDTNTPLTWKIRVHLMMCANCRRFVRHLKITQSVTQKIAITDPTTDAEKIWQELQQKIKQDSQQD